MTKKSKLSAPPILRNNLSDGGFVFDLLSTLLVRVSKFRLAWMLVFFSYSTFPVYAILPISDQEDGATCEFYMLGYRTAWDKRGGDWSDRDGRGFGNKPFAIIRVSGERSREKFVLDVTSLARSWGGDSRVYPGGVFLRVSDLDDGGVVNFVSRESHDRSASPVLSVKLFDGTVVSYEPVADTYMPCSTIRSLGKELKFKVGRNVNALLVFPVDRAVIANMVSAELSLTSTKQYGPSAIGIYGARFPFLSSPGAVRSGVSSNFILDRGIERHPSVLFVERFEGNQWIERFSGATEKGAQEVVSRDDVNRFSVFDGSALKVSVLKGEVTGMNVNFRFDSLAEGEPEEMYFRYYLRLGENWNPTKEGGKLPGFAGTYNRGGWGGRRSNGVNGWVAQGSFLRWRDSSSPLNGFRGIGSYVYHVDMNGNYGSSWGWNRGYTGVLQKNRWYCVEQYVRMNTPGRNDGVLRSWVDGLLAFEKVDLRFRDVSHLKIEALWMNVYHGGTTPTDADLSLYIDNLVVSREYIGPVRLMD